MGCGYSSAFKLWDDYLTKVSVPLKLFFSSSLRRKAVCQNNASSILFCMKYNSICNVHAFHDTSNELSA